MRILGIETSCDETGVAIYDKKNGLLINKLYSQAKIHANYGGVVPELASRYHIQKTIPLIQTALEQTNMHISDINGIAYTAGPGLVNSLMVGATIGCTLAYSLQIPAIAVNHIEGHLLTSMLEKKSPNFPFLALLVSGRHTQLISVINIGKYKILGESIDDAAGEAFDKTAKLLGINYPGGAQLASIATKGRPGRYIFPRPMTDKPGLKFSFSGLKTFASKIILNSKNDCQTRYDIARAFEDAIVDTLTIKCRRALDLTGFNRLLIAGGVSANKSLRFSLNKLMQERGGTIFFSCIELCTDNGAMIAYVGMRRFHNNIQSNLSILVRPHWRLEELPILTAIT